MTLSDLYLQTLPSSTESPVKSQNVTLPPLQMNALPASTVSRLESLSVDEDSTGTPVATQSKRPPQQAARGTRPLRIGDGSIAKATLPTIAGSPSVAANAAASLSEAANHSPKPATPTRIPRLAGNRSASGSPQAPVAKEGENQTAQAYTDAVHRRGSLAPGAGMSSSMPQQHHAYLSPQSASTSSSSDSYTDSQMQLEQGGSSSESAANSNVSAPRSSRQAAVQVPSTPSKGIPQTLHSTRSSLRSVSLTNTTNKTEKRRSLVLADEGDSKSSKTGLRSSQPTVRTSSKLSATAPSSVPSSLATPRNRTKTSDALSPSASGTKASLLSDGLPASKSHRGLASKLSIPSRITRSSTTPSLSQSHSPAPSDGGRSTSSSRYGTPLGEDDLKADDEMSEFLQRQKTRKSPSGLTEEEIARMLDFPEPIEPRVPLPPDGESGTRVTELQADD